MFLLFRYLKNFRKETILGPIFKLLEAIFELIVPLVMAKIIDDAIPQVIETNQINPILGLGGLMIGLGVIGLASSLCCQFFASRASQGYGTILRNELYAHINTLSHAQIDQFGTPSLINRMSADINQMQIAVAMLIRLVIRAPFLAIGATIMAMMINIEISLIFVIASIIISVILYIIMSRSIPYYQKIQTELDGVSVITRENLNGARVIRAFSNQEYEQKRFDEATQKLVKSSIRVEKISSLLNPLTYVVANLAIIAILYFGGLQVYSGELTQGKIIALINYMTQILLALIVVANLVVIFTKASASAKRINEVFNTKTNIHNGLALQVINTDPTIPQLALKNVGFAYSDHQYTLNGISFSIYKHQIIGIIGTTGSGKSTLVQLLLRYYDATSGDIQLKGIDIRDYDLDYLRSFIAMVPQHAVLFRGTIRENMQMRKSDATDQEIWEALEVAQAADFVAKIKQGLDYEIVQGGKNLSGGQRQRLTIARTLIGRPEIVILDDSSSALDLATEAKLRQSIKTKLTNTTVIIVSQRISAIQHADKIIVLDDGEIVAIGTHQELLNQCDVYQNIYTSQVEGGSYEA